MPRRLTRSGSGRRARKPMCRNRFRYRSSSRRSTNCWGCRAPEGRPSRLLDLGFLEVDMLAHDRVVLAHAHLLGLGARVLLRHVEKAGIGAADELDLDGCRLGHRTSQIFEMKKAAPASAAL